MNLTTEFNINITMKKDEKIVIQKNIYENENITKSTKDANKPLCELLDVK